MSSVASTNSDKEQLAHLILKWRDQGPAVFAQEALGASPTPQQFRASEKLVKRRRVSIRSGHGTGKSTFASWTILWGVVCFFPVKIPCTAPTGHQLSDVLWSELSMWHRILKEKFPWVGEQFVWKGDSFNLIQYPKESFAVARTSRRENPEALQGFHSDTIIFVIDEASGVPEEVFQVAEGALSTEGAFVLMIANPTRMEGYFYESHHKMRDSWATEHWDGEDSPLVSRQYILDMEKKYGRESAIFKIRVNGDFAGNPDGIIPLDMIEGAINRNVEPFGDIVWGVDVARFGKDRSSLAKRQGNKLLEKVLVWSGKDTMQLSGIIKNEFDETPTKQRPVSIFIDVIGIGAGVVDRCKEMQLPVIGVNVAETPSAKEKYARLRDEVWFRAREWFEGKDVSIPEDEELIGELTLPTYKLTSTGKIQVESKDDLKKRGVSSPDIADAFCLTFARGLYVRGSKQWGKPIQYPNLAIP